MRLPDISRLDSSHELLRDLGRTLRRLGVSLAAAAPVVTAAAVVPAQQRRPIRAHHLRKMRDPRGYAMRMLMFRDPVSAEEASAALGASVGPLVEAGLLVRNADGTIVSPFILSVLDTLYILSDDLSAGSDAVMGFADTTVALCGAAVPRRPVGRVLEIGCGSGTGAILLSQRAREVVATDINPRALTLARANAALNDRKGISFREGDLFAPVAGESFDLILSQPPFVARPEGVADAAFMYGGARGDEIALALIREVPKHLAPGGRAVLFVEWPVMNEEKLENRIREALGAGPNLLVLEGPPGGLDAHCAAYSAGLHPDLGAAFTADAILRLEHFERLGIRALTPTVVVIEPTQDGRGWTSTVPTEPFARVSFSSERIDKIFAARALAASRDRVLGAKLRVPAETTFAQEQVGPGAEVPSTCTARLPPDALIAPVGLNLELLGLVTFVHEAETVREGIVRLAETLEIPMDRAMEQGTEAVTDALVHGLLEVEKV